MTRPATPGSARRTPAASLLLLFIGLRVGLWLWMWLVVQQVAMPLWPDDKLRPHYGVAIETNPILAPWQRWDTLHYQAIAERGYSAFDTAVFVPPLFPGLMRLGASVLGGNNLLAGLVLSSIATLVLFFALYRLSRDELRDSGAAWRTVLYLALFPSAFFLFAAYTESIFLLAAVLTLWHVRRTEWLRAGAWASLASLSRLPGALILVPVAWEALRAFARTRKAYPLAGLALGLAGALAFPLYVWARLGLAPWAPLLAQAQRFGGGFTFPGVNLVHAIANAFGGPFFLTDGLDILFLLGAVALFIPVWRTLPRVYGIYYATYLALYLTRTGGTEPLVGMVRYVLVLFPAFLVVGAWGANRFANRVVVYSGLAGLLFMSASFALWIWMG
ncbi:MAG: hypothetical protein A2Z30_02130 [Chloroflexi bacterium RBG_16_64_43]|nr:MAG: hypothetical protein A2Z30_02130 [Chloroflexi bacterium RBG_16_64_43]